MEKTKELELQENMNVLLQSAEESYLLGDDNGYDLLRKMVYSLYAQGEIPLPALIRAEQHFSQVETAGAQVKLLDLVRLRRNWKAPEKEAVQRALGWLETIGREKGESEFAQAREYISDYWNTVWE